MQKQNSISDQAGEWLNLEFSKHKNLDGPLNYLQVAHQRFRDMLMQISEVTLSSRKHAYSNILKILPQPKKKKKKKEKKKKNLR